MTRHRVGLRATILLALLLVLLGNAAPATAATAGRPQLPIPGLPECRQPPAAQSPDRGFSGFITPRPTNPPAVDADPFTTGSGVSVYETNGLAGYRWHMYVDSCIPGAGQATNQALNGTANSLMSFPVLAVGVVATLADAVYNQTWLQTLDKPVAYVSGALYDGFTRPFFPVLAVAVGIVMLISIRRARLSAAIGTACLVLVAATLAAFAANYPTTVAEQTDRITVSAITSVNGAIAGSDSADPAAATVAPLVDAILYDRWVAGTLGDTDSPVARQYGPELYQASTLTWAETDILRHDPSGAGAELLEAKEEQWRTAAEAVQQRDPDAYEYLIGARSLDRLGHALVAVALVGVLPFLLMSLLLVAMSYLIIRLVVMFLPLVALVALLLRGTLRSLVSLAAAALINSVVFAIGAAVTAYLYGVFLSPESGIPAVLGIFLAFVVGIAMWIVLSPYRRLTTMVRGTDAVRASTTEYRKYKKTGTDLAGSAARFAAGTAKVAAGNMLATKLSKNDKKKHQDSDPYRYGPGQIRPEHFATAAPAGPHEPRTGPPDELPASPVPSALAAPSLAALPGPRTYYVPLDEPTTDTAVAPEAAPGRHAARAISQAAAPDTTTSEPRPEPPAGHRPESKPLRDFDPVVVDGRDVPVIHTLDGPIIDTEAIDGPDGAQHVVPGDVVTSRREPLP
ncbi:hypothetical protein [Jannaschia sp. R86511]|uniref:hypothetical protein n=1 Tax=Jannaschia sp. R86511 TaxID=3093853 RepID=UPI0036D39F7E